MQEELLQPELAMNEIPPRRDGRCRRPRFVLPGRATRAAGRYTYVRRWFICHARLQRRLKTDRRADRIIYDAAWTDVHGTYGTNWDETV